MNVILHPTCFAHHRFAMDEVARETVMEALSQNNVKVRSFSSHKWMHIVVLLTACAFAFAALREVEGGGERKRVAK